MGRVLGSPFLPGVLRCLNGFGILMIEKIFQDYSKAEALLEQYGLMITPAELHGVVAGLLCGGVSTQDRKWLTEVIELVNNGEQLTAAVRGWVVELFDATRIALSEQNGLELLLPDDDADFSLRLEAVSELVQAFLAGFAVTRKNLSDASEELQEIIKDLSSISLMDDEFDDSVSEENEDAYLVVYEHIKLGMMLAYDEFGFSNETEKSPTIH